MSDSPLVLLCNLFENQSRNGGTYFAGYLGNAKVLILRNKIAAPGTPQWQLLITERPQTRQTDRFGPSRVQRAPQPPKSAPVEDAPFDDGVPF